MLIREPAVAGAFYAADPRRCHAEIDACLKRAAAPPAFADSDPPPQHVIGAVVPHAGWICSGAVAARAVAALASRRTPETVVVFGAIHVPHGPTATIYAAGAWRTPIGLAPIADDHAAHLLRHIDLLESNPNAHAREHSIEVEVPFLQHLLPNAKIVPIMVPPGPDAVTLGRAVGEAFASSQTDVAFLASTDLTHYGPRFGFTPRGLGEAGVTWARDVNDRRMIDAIRRLREETIVGEARANWNACGPGAVAATIAACKALGATRAVLLEHTTSHDVLRGLDPDGDDSVGYAGMLIG